MEYFGQKLDGFAFTTGGWVQSYGSRYVRPPLIHADVVRPSAMTVKEFAYAQGLTHKPVKGMLTGAGSDCFLRLPRTAAAAVVCLCIMHR